ncbi:MAG: hypothetical protein VXZ53_11275, partial [Planctomycetota bacterium]|nr:hypothetical protein [Planctomycetota bacterium]
MWHSASTPHGQGIRKKLSKGWNAVFFVKDRERRAGCQWTVITLDRLMACDASNLMEKLASLLD